MTTRIFTPGSWVEDSRTARILRAETTGGVLLIGAAVLALVWANTPWRDAYDRLCATTFGPESLDLHLSLAQWASDGLLAVFFFVAGLEVKREFVAGDLREPRRALLPVCAAVGGMIVPALLYVACNVGGATQGWAIPTATDIAYAVAILAVLGTHLPGGLRTFLLTLAVVDDLLAITVIALFYTDHLRVLDLVAAAVPIACFGVLVQRRIRTPWLLIPLALVAWGLMHASGIHATVAGVLLAFTVPVRRQAPETDGPAGRRGLAEHLEHLLRPISAGVAVPAFALLSAGVYVGGAGGLRDALGDPVTIGVIVGLVAGKPIGIIGATWLLARFTRAELDAELAWVDVIGMGLLAGIGFTVSLLIGELAFEPGSITDDRVKVGIVLAGLISTALAAAVLGHRNGHYRRLALATTARSELRDR